MSINSRAEKWVGNTGLKRLTIDIDPKLHLAFKLKVESKGKNMRQVIEKYIKTYTEIQKHD